MKCQLTLGRHPINDSANKHSESNGSKANQCLFKNSDLLRYYQKKTYRNGNAVIQRKQNVFDYFFHFFTLAVSILLSDIKIVI